MAMAMEMVMGGRREGGFEGGEGGKRWGEERLEARLAVPGGGLGRLGIPLAVLLVATRGYRVPSTATSIDHPRLAGAVPPSKKPDVPQAPDMGDAHGAAWRLAACSTQYQPARHTDRTSAAKTPKYLPTLFI